MKSCLQMGAGFFVLIGKYYTHRATLVAFLSKMLLYNNRELSIAVILFCCYNTDNKTNGEGVVVMKQWSSTRYQLKNDALSFLVSDIDVNFYACKYIDSSMGFVMDKDVFNKHLISGKIHVVDGHSIAV